MTVYSYSIFLFLIVIIITSHRKDHTISTIPDSSWSTIGTFHEAFSSRKHLLISYSLRIGLLVKMGFVLTGKLRSWQLISTLFYSMNYFYPSIIRFSSRSNGL